MRERNLEWEKKIKTEFFGICSFFFFYFLETPLSLRKCLLLLFIEGHEERAVLITGAESSYCFLLDTRLVR